MYDLVIPNPLDVAATASPGAIALEWDGRQWTFASLRDAAAAAAPGLRDAAHEGRIGVLSLNRAGYAIAVQAAARLGAAVVPLNWRLSPEELRWQVHDAGISLLLADEGNEDVARTLAAELGISVCSIEAFEQTPPASPVALAPPLSLARDAAIIYTSGTTGSPKGARITFGNLWFSAVASGLHLGHQPDDAWLATLPLFHIGGFSILYRSVIERTRVILHDRFDPEAVLNAIGNGATMISVVPQMMPRLLALPSGARRLRQARCILVGGAATPASLLARCQDLGVPIAPTYGLTESTAQLATLLPSEIHRKPGSVGRSLPLSHLRIVTPDGDAAPGEIGEITFAGPTRFAGYLGESADSTMAGDGWFSTGDLGYVDEDGYLYVVDRRDDLIVSGGENIYPAELEQMLLSHPAIRDAAVVGAPDPDWGARPVAFIVWDGPEPATEIEQQTLQFCQERLARYKLPVEIVVKGELPRSASGKLLRRELQQIAATGRGASG
jgi:O-succinylbenzoic acid--CoA ligase